MGLGSLQTALSGLAVSQRQIDLISNNVANVSTPGYTRKLLPQSTQAIGGQGAGVIAGDVFRFTNLALSKQVWTQTSAVEYSAVREQYLSRIEQFHGPAEAESSIAAEITRLRDSFTNLSGNPSDTLAQKATLSQAQDTAATFQELSRHITQLRNDAQNEMRTVVNDINAKLDQIVDANAEIVKARALGLSTATPEDFRDTLISELSELIEIDYYFRGDGTMVVQTNQGAELASDKATHMIFEPSLLAPGNSYPENVSGVHVGDPITAPYSVDLTAASPGGKLGALLTLRDETFPKEMAQLDELAYQMAARFEAQGLTLFVGRDGEVPSEAAPDLSTDPPTPVSYVGFARDIQVNSVVVEDISKLQTGTDGGDHLNFGDSSVINRILDYTFGTVSHQSALGNIDLRVSTQTPPTTLQSFLGLRASARVEGAVNINDYANFADFNAATGGSIGATNNTMRIVIEEPDLGLGPIALDIDLSAVPDAAGIGFGDELVNYINTTVIGALPAAQATALSDMNAQFSINSNGQLSITGDANITIDATGAAANPIGENGLSFLGLASGTTEAEDPYLDISVGTNEFTRITIEPNDTEIELINKLNNIPGLAAQIDPATGALQLRPGNDFTDPDFGGSLKIVSGHFRTDGASANTIIGAGTIEDGVNVASALFASFTSGSPPTDVSPVQDVNYGSDISASNTNRLSFRENFLGPNGSISTNIAAPTNLIDYAQRLINEHAQELNQVRSQQDDSTTFRNLLQDQLSNETGVNIDEEMAHLVVVQNTYSASARVVNAIQEMFDELFNIL